jgi:hypothetical protein
MMTHTNSTPANPTPPGWPDPLESPQAEAIRNGKLDDTEIRNLFDCMERELRLHRERAANPAQVTDAARNFMHLFVEDSIDPPALTLEVDPNELANRYEALSAALSAAIGAGGQAVADVETVARIVDPCAWANDLPVPTRADTIQFHERRQASCEMARRILSTIAHPVQPGWRDMASAPKDGTKIQVWADGYEWPEVIYYESYDNATAIEAGTPGYWRYADNLFADVAEVEEAELTSWMPIPAAPQPEGE